MITQAGGCGIRYRGKFIPDEISDLRKVLERHDRLSRIAVADPGTEFSLHIIPTIHTKLERNLDRGRHPTQVSVRSFRPLPSRDQTFQPRTGLCSCQPGLGSRGIEHGFNSSRPFGMQRRQTQQLSRPLSVCSRRRVGDGSSDRKKRVVVRAVFLGITLKILPILVINITRIEHAAELARG